MTDDVFGIVGTTQCGSFRVERVVAEGGFSVVYKAQHGAFRAPVALKCLKVPGAMSAADSGAFLEKLREEAELLFRLSATIPEVVRPLHVDVLDLKDRFVPFLALEWLEGEALDEMLRRRQSALAEQIADLVKRRQTSWQASPGQVKAAPTVGSIAAGRFQPGSLRSAAMAWNKPEG